MDYKTSLIQLNLSPLPCTGLRSRMLCLPSKCIREPPDSFNNLDNISLNMLSTRSTTFNHLKHNFSAAHLTPATSFSITLLTLSLIKSLIDSPGIIKKTKKTGPAKNQNVSYSLPFSNVIVPLLTNIVVHFFNHTFDHKICISL